ncbi:aldose epimerase family protein [Bacillus marasmi]|uniref:aldose epimerase family protein n=1 Tax=Bacillus marasmi TaxID=1926279 RepID=UPI0011C9CED0|nr:aldose epimerase family protein [Bacillus marasmi]
MKLVEGVYGVVNGRHVKSYAVETSSGMKFTCIEYGCIITEILIPDSNGLKENVVLGFDTLAEYIDHSPYFGCVIGRNAGRIGGAAFEIDGVTYHLANNDGENNLHSGANGFHNVIWDSAVVVKDTEVSITFSYMSPDGEAGFPGNLQVEVTYTINENNELLIQYQAQSDQNTIVNLTNHSYFNLSGNLKRTILDHELTLHSDGFLELDETLIPTGEIISVEGTPFEFRKSKQIGQGIEAGHPQITLVGGGYDHPFLLSPVQNQSQMTLFDLESGRKLEIETEEPAVVFYSGNMLTDDFNIRGTQSQKHLGLCLETQKPPNMIDDLRFPSIILEKNQQYTTQTVYSFGWDEGTGPMSHQ